jgi:hypothetical protein
MTSLRPFHHPSTHHHHRTPDATAAGALSVNTDFIVQGSSIAELVAAYTELAAAHAKLVADVAVVSARQLIKGDTGAAGLNGPAGPTGSNDPIFLA